MLPLKETVEISFLIATPPLHRLTVDAEDWVRRRKFGESNQVVAGDIAVLEIKQDILEPGHEVKVRTTISMTPFFGSGRSKPYCRNQ